MKKALDTIFNVLATLAALLFMLIFILIVSEIISRTFLNYSILWVTDFCTLTVCWMLAFGMAAGLYKADHLRIDFIKMKFPKGVIHGVDIFTNILATAFFAMLIFTGYSTAITKMEIAFTTLRWPTGYSFMALPVFAFFATVFMICRTVNTIKAALGKETEHGTV